MTDQLKAAIAGVGAALAAFNAEDVIRTRWSPFPHVRVHSGKVTVMQRPEDYHNVVWSRSGQSAGWARAAGTIRR